MQKTWQLKELASWRGRRVDAEDGERIGILDEVVYDYRTQEPLWLVVGSGLLGAHLLLIPAAEAVDAGPVLRTGFRKQFIQDEPVVELGEGWSYGDDAEQLYRYFGMTASPQDDIRVLHRHDFLPGLERVHGGDGLAP